MLAWQLLRTNIIPVLPSIPICVCAVPAPKHLTLERQLNKSVLIGWSPPEPCGYNLIDSYHVYVDGVLKVTVKANERTRALIEGVDSNRVSGIHPLPVKYPILTANMYVVSALASSH